MIYYRLRDCINIICYFTVSKIVENVEGFVVSKKRKFLSLPGMEYLCSKLNFYIYIFV